MKRLILLAMSLLVAALLAVGLSSQARAGGNGAEVVREGGQTCLASNNTDSWFFSCNFQIVFQPNGAITQYLTGSVIPEGSSPLPSKATNVSGGPCLTIGGEVLTTVVAGVVTPSGQVSLICKS